MSILYLIGMLRWPGGVDSFFILSQIWLIGVVLCGYGVLFRFAFQWGLVMV